MAKPNVHRHNTYSPPVLNPAQLETLIALCDTLFQSHSGDQANLIREKLPKDAPDWQVAVVDEFISKSFSDLPNSTDYLIDFFGNALSPKVQSDLMGALTLLSTTAGTCVLTGGYLRPFPKLTLKEREETLQAWSISKLALRRGIIRAFSSLALFCIYAYSDLLNDAIGYPSPSRRLLAKPLQAPKFIYTFITPPICESENEIPIYNTEVLIIGSGAGGGVTSSRLAPGYKTLIVEKGIYAPTGEKIRGPHEAFNELFQNAGILASESGSISFFAGSALGGGTTINWSGSLKTQHYVREEWAKKGLDYFLTDDYSNSLDKVCERMGVSAKHIKQSKANSVLIKGCNRLGYHVDPIPRRYVADRNVTTHNVRYLAQQNTDGAEHSCGFCSYGCPYGEKQGTVETFMVDAAKAGAGFLVRAQTDRLLFMSPNEEIPLTLTMNDLTKYTYTPGRTRCIGAEITLDDGGKLVVLASKSVVVSGGSINSPAILLRSGLKNHNIGRNLHCHPATYITGTFEEQINPWDGAIMTAVSNVCENKDGTHHGAKLEVCFSMPSGLAGAQESWYSSAEHKAMMLNYNHSLTLITLTRDRDSGQVFLDPNGNPRINYDVSEYDQDSATKATVAACEILLAAGAKRIATSQATVQSYIPKKDHKGLVDPDWKEWIKSVENSGMKAGWTSYASAHQMGTCAMGTSQSNSVVDYRGRVWNTSNLYVADASIFPSASGVNPMITVMACAYSIAGFILEDLGKEEVV